MATRKTTLSKISRPAIFDIIRRERLFTLLDAGAAKPLTWLSAPGGSGKSTLVASYLDARQLPCLWYQCDEGDADPATFFYYIGLAAKQAAPRFRKPLPLLTPEYLAGIPTFTRRYFEILFSRCTTIVLDNYQDVPVDSPFHETIAAGLATIPEGVRVLVISRSEPPLSLARLQAQNKIKLLTGTDLGFTLEETMLLAHDCNPDLDSTHIRALHKKTEGWVAGIILMLENGGFDGTLSEPAADRVFDYFAGEVFNRLEREKQDFLLKTSFLSLVTVPLANKLTGVDSGAHILASLNRHHLFTDRLSGGGEDYQYHQLFRDFLRNRAQSTFSSRELAAIQSEAALLLEQAGQIEDAARLYCEAGQREGLSRIVTRHARELLMQGRNRTVEEWLSCTPAGAAEDPWLLYWNGLCSFPVDMPRTRAYLEQACTIFKATGDISGLFLCWAGIVDTYAFGEGWKNLDGCITAFDDLSRKYPSFPSPEIELIVASRMLIALTLRKTDQPHRVEAWLQRVSALLQKNPSFDILMDTMFSMSVYYLWKGEYDKNAVLLERAVAEIRHRRPSPFALIRINLMKGIHYWITAEYEAALHSLSEGLDVSAKSGVHVYDSLLWSFRVAAEMASGNLEHADNSLKQQLNAMLGMETELNNFFFHINSAWHALLTGNPSRAVEHMEPAFARTESMGTPYYRALWHIGMAQATFQRNHPKDARKHIRTAHRISLTMKSQVMEWYSHLIEAWFSLREGKQIEGLLAMHRGLSLGRRYGYVHLEFYQPNVMRFLCATALEEGIEPEYVKGLIGKLALTPPQPPDYEASACCPEEWPYHVKIYTLGRFEIVRDGEPLHFAGKEQKRPLDLLKALIALGGSGVPEERLTDRLWPDADGDQARKSFEMNLTRLRKLLGGDDYLVLRARRLSINPLHCWVDSLALGHLFDAARNLPDGQAASICKRALGLYKGAFLAAESSAPWALSMRETLKNRLLRIILMAGRQYEQAGEWGLAADYYTIGIEADSLAEELYRRMMVCQRNLGNHADAARTYQRCCSLLQAELGIAPSPETTSVYDSIAQKQ